MTAPTISLIVACYGQRQMMSVFYDSVFAWHRAVRAEVELIVVDDCGDPKQTIPNDMGLWGHQLLRVEKNIPWNQMGARNLGLHVARGEWVLMLDPDCTIRRLVMMNLLLETRHGSGKAVRLLGLSCGGKVDMTSPNMWFGPKRVFDDVGGYDEDYAGNKGWSDVLMLHTIKGFGYSIVKEPRFCVDYHEDIHEIPDCRVVTLDRSVKTNRALHLRKHALGNRIGWRRYVKENKGKNLRFPWKLIDSKPSKD